MRTCVIYSMGSKGGDVLPKVHKMVSWGIEHVLEKVQPARRQ